MYVQPEKKTTYYVIYTESQIIYQMNGDVTFFIFQYDVIETFMNFIIHTKRFF